MKSKIKIIPFVVLGIVSIVCSKMLFIFLDDPEGPNLLIVVAAAVVIYIAFLTIYTVLLHNKSKK
jgi:heme/copper-type cytochrome/quinol oxidase subunit 4